MDDAQLIIMEDRIKRQIRELRELLVIVEALKIQRQARSLEPVKEEE